MRIAVVTSGFLPIPATKGGAVENLLMNIINENEQNKCIELHILSIFDEQALEKSKTFNNTTFEFINPNFVVKKLDLLIFFIVKNIFRKKNSQSYRYVFQRLYYFYKCSQILHDNDFDKILLENHPSQYLTLKWKRNYIKYKNNYYYHCHNKFHGTYGCANIIRKTRRIICVSNFRKNSVMDFMNMKQNQFSVLLNAIDTTVIAKKANLTEITNLKKQYNISKDDKILLFIGRIVPGKGIAELLEALKKVKYQNYKLLLLGASLNSLKVKNRFEQDILMRIDDDIKDKIIFTGFIEYNSLYKFYTIADIAVLPSVMEDSAPLSVIESLCCGLPIITTDSGGIPEYAKNGSAIILKRKNHFIENLSVSIDELLNDNQKRKIMSKNAILASKNLTLEKYYLEFLKQIDYKE